MRFRPYLIISGSVLIRTINYLLSSMLTKPAQQWISYAKPRKRYLFFYEEQVLDLTDFAAVHPGGKKALTNYIFKDITDILFSVYPHKKDHTLGVLQRYVIGLIPESLTSKRLKTDKSLTKNSNNPSKEKKKVCFKKKFIACEEEDSDSQISNTAKKGSKKEKSTKAGMKSSKVDQKKKPTHKKQDVSILVLSEKALKQMEMNEEKRLLLEKQNVRKEEIDRGNLSDEIDQKIGKIRIPFMNIHSNVTVKR